MTAHGTHRTYTLDRAHKHPQCRPSQGPTGSMACRTRVTSCDTCRPGHSQSCPRGSASAPRSAKKQIVSQNPGHAILPAIDTYIVQGDSSYSQLSPWAKQV